MGVLTLTTAEDLFAPYARAGELASFVRRMRDMRLTPDEVLRLYDEWMAARMADMVPATQNNAKRVAMAVEVRHKAGDVVQMPDACPRCGATVELLQLCHLASPVWRTQLACMADGCAWHGKSKLPIDVLIAAGAKNIKHNVTEG